MLIVFTNLDSCLLNQEGDDCQLMVSIIEKLKNQGIPLILVTSQTSAEVKDLRDK